jgi:hypothetical protein
MYSSCDTDPNLCTALNTTTCLQLGAGGGAACTDGTDCAAGEGCFDSSCGAVDDAFCTNTNCSNPALDCDPAPGDAPPICVNSSWCALDCTTETCPTGMTCYDVTVANICA